MANYSSILVQKITQAEEPSRVQCTESQRVGHDWAHTLEGLLYLSRRKRLLISWLQSPSTAILEPKKTKSLTVSTFSPFICHEVMRPNAMIFVCLFFLMLSFKPAFSLSSFTLIKRLFSSSSLFAIRVVSSAYLRLLIFLPAILLPACDSSSLAFHTYTHFR